MNKLRVCKVMLLKLVFLHCGTCYSMDNDNRRAIFFSSSVSFRTKIGRTRLEEFINNSDGAIEETSTLGRKIRYPDGTVVISQQNRILLYKEGFSITYVFNKDGLLQKEIGL